MLFLSLPLVYVLLFAFNNYKSDIANKPPNQTGKVSPRNSRANSTGEGSVALGASAGKRGSVSTASTNSPVESSPLRWELSADGTGAAVGVGDAGSGGSGMEMGSIREE